VRTAQTGAEAVELARTFRPDAVLLDLMLPDMTGFEVLRLLRAGEPGLPVLFVTARDGAEDRVAGLTAGGDDYIAKPFRLEDVCARLRQVLRRSATAGHPTDVLVVGDLVLDDERREVTRDGDVIALSATEYELVRHLMRNAGRVLPKDEILEWVWQYDFGGQGSIVELYMSYLRRKIDSGRPPMIRTVRGVGYLLEPGS
jgi:two-component system OmpR family response regulator